MWKGQASGGEAVWCGEEAEEDARCGLSLGGPGLRPTPRSPPRDSSAGAFHIPRVGFLSPSSPRQPPLTCGCHLDNLGRRSSPRRTLGHSSQRQGTPTHRAAMPQPSRLGSKRPVLPAEAAAGAAARTALEASPWQGDVTVRHTPSSVHVPTARTGRGAGAGADERLQGSGRVRE